MAIKNILWPTDLSETSFLALPKVTEISGKFGAKVHLLYVADDLSRHDHYYGDADPAMLKDLQKRECGWAEKALANVCDRELAGCADFVKEVRKGEPVEAILQRAAEDDVDLIIMASRGRDKKARAGVGHFGSVAERVMKNSPVPVMLVNP